MSSAFLTSAVSLATTAGGVKLLRVYALFRHGERELERLVHPSSIGGAGQTARRLRREGAYLAWIFFILFACAIGVSVALMTLVGVAFEPAMILTVAALTSARKKPTASSRRVELCLSSSVERLSSSTRVVFCWVVRSSSLIALLTTPTPAASVGDPHANAAAMLDLAREADEKGVDLIVDQVSGGVMNQNRRLPLKPERMTPMNSIPSFNAPLEAIAPISREAFRDGMAKMAAAVNIITTDGPAGRAGFAATAVCSAC